MASCSITFRKPKSAEEERKLIENAIPKSTLAVTKWSVKTELTELTLVKIFLERQNVTKSKNPAIELKHEILCTHHLLSVEC